MEPIGYGFGLAASDFSSVAILLLVAAGLVVAILVLTHLIGPRRVGAVKHDTYESGMEPVGDTRRRFGVRFYLIAVLFLIFDVELIFLYPWAVLFPRMRADADTEQYASVKAMVEAGYTPAVTGLAVGVFFALLLVGFVYEWRRGVFKWN